ncbi:MAG TPA: CoA transferase [Deltaproteobacteria bacterium]|nr:CoA transferase [Deltaproteobacteria bacterium]
MNSILSGIRVLDLSRHISGPHGASLLADLGAEVIRVERPGGEEDRYMGLQGPSGDGFMFLNQARNKKAITLNLMAGGEALALFLELVKRSDVLIHNFSTGAVEQMGISYERLRAVNKALVYAEITGFGSRGPYARRLGFDQIAQAMSGAMHLTGFPDTPPQRSEVRYVDFAAGAYAALGIVSALYRRRLTAEGQKVETNLLQTAVVLNAMAVSEYEATGKKRSRIGNRSWYTGPSDLYRSRDGKWVYISLVTKGLFRRFCKLIEREDLAERPDLETDYQRFKKRDEIDVFVKNWVAERDASVCEKELQKARLPCGIVNDVDEVASDPQVAFSSALVDVKLSGGEELKLAGIPVGLSENPGTVTAPPPATGEHNREIYCGLLGVGDEELSKLIENGII